MVTITCSFVNCSMSKVKAQETGSNVAFFRYPKSPELRKAWLERSGRNQQSSADYLYVCSLHFSADDFERDLRNELLNLPTRVILKPGVIPTSEVQIHSGEIFLADAEQNSQLQTVAIDPNSVFIVKSEDVEMNDSADGDSDPFKDLEEVDSIAKLEAENAELRKKIAEQDKQLIHNEKYMKKYRGRINVLQGHSAELKKKLQNVDVVNREKLEAMNKILTRAQQDVIYKRKKMVHWGEEDFTKAYTLSRLNKEAFTYLRDYLKYPLPGHSSLKRWITKSRHEMEKENEAAVEDE